MDTFFFACIRISMWVSLTKNTNLLDALGGLKLPFPPQKNARYPLYVSLPSILYKDQQQKSYLNPRKSQ